MRDLHVFIGYIDTKDITMKRHDYHIFTVCIRLQIPFCALATGQVASTIFMTDLIDAMHRLTGDFASLIHLSTVQI